MTKTGTIHSDGTYHFAVNETGGKAPDIELTVPDDIAPKVYVGCTIELYLDKEIHYFEVTGVNGCDVIGKRLKK